MKGFNSQLAADQLDKYFQKIQAKSQNMPMQIKVFSPRLSLDYTYPAGSSNQPYHVASIGKLFTATLVQLLAERGLLSMKDLIAHHLPPTTLERLFIYQGIDYAEQVTIEHLLGHTSGVADYFEGKTTSDKSFIVDIITNPGTHWTPQKLLDYTREYQTAVGLPGQVFNYSDTGYILLGLLIEKVTRKPFARNLLDEFFQPLEMRDLPDVPFRTSNTPKKISRKSGSINWR
jgi:D-alanyl-D-alanine carboxypeptidase